MKAQKNFSTHKELISIAKQFKFSFCKIKIILYLLKMLRLQIREYWKINKLTMHNKQSWFTKSTLLINMDLKYPFQNQ